MNDQVFCGDRSYTLVAVIVGSRVLRPTAKTDYHYYVEHADGRMTRHLDVAEALEAAALPHVKVQLLGNSAVDKARGDFA